MKKPATSKPAPKTTYGTLKDMARTTPAGHIEAFLDHREAKQYVDAFYRSGRKATLQMAVLHEPSEGWKVTVRG